MNNVRSIFDIHPGLELTKVLTHEYHFSDAWDKPYTHLLSLQISPFRRLASGGGITKMSLSICSIYRNTVLISTAWMS